MVTCRVCLRQFVELRFRSDRISICGRCVNTLNESPEVAEHAEKRLGELLLRGMERRALRDLTCDESWRRSKAEWTLANLGAAHVKAMPKWLNRILADPKNTSRDFKVLRAHRRGLLHYDRPAGWGYPKNWKEIASRIRRLDNFQCVVCAARDQTIDVHHIVYVSNFGTHQQANLGSLCRTCHEAEHKRSFDLGETASEYTAPPTQIQVAPASSPAPSSHPASVQPELPTPPQPRSLAMPMPAECPRSAKPDEATGPSGGAPSVQRFCGHCRTLVVPRRRFLWIKQCPNCGCSI